MGLFANLNLVGIRNKKSQIIQHGFTRKMEMETWRLPKLMENDIRAKVWILERLRQYK